MFYVDLLGYVAGTLTTVAYIPQVIKTHTSKSTKDLSLLWLAVLDVGLAAWAAYGVALASYPLIITNLVPMSMVTYLAYLKLRLG